MFGGWGVSSVGEGASQSKEAEFLPAFGGWGVEQCRLAAARPAGSQHAPIEVVQRGGGLALPQALAQLLDEGRVQGGQGGQLRVGCLGHCSGGTRQRGGGDGQVSAKAARASRQQVQWLQRLLPPSSILSHTLPALDPLTRQHKALVAADNLHTQPEGEKRVSPLSWLVGWLYRCA